MLLKRYLSDEIAPMIFANNASEIFDIPAEVVAGEIQSWIGDQVRGASNMTAGELISHAASKIHQLGVLELIPHEEIGTFLAGLRPHLMSLCPVEERQALMNNFQHFETSSSLGASTVEVLHKRGSGMPAAGPAGAAHGQRAAAGSAGVAAAFVPGGGAGAAAVAAPAASQAALARLNLLLDRLQATGAAASASAAAPARGDREVLAHVIEEVAARASSTKEVETQLGFLEDLGISSLGAGVIQQLSQALPDWAPPAHSEAGAAAAQSPASAARAMSKLVELSKDRDELVDRFTELLSAAVEECNKGALGRAVTMLDLADRMVSQKKVDVSSAAAVIETWFRRLDRKQLYLYSDDPTKRSLLRRLMAFFPELRVGPLLESLKDEADREERLEILKLLRAHGDDARAEAINALDESINGAVPLPWHVERNLLYLMRSIPRPDDEHIDHEIDLLIRTSDLNNPVPVIRESFTSLVDIDHPRAVTTLDARVSELEDALLGNLQLPVETKDVRWLISFAFKQLAQNPLPQAREIVINHGLKGNPELGDTHARLAQLGGQDLSDTPDQLQRILDAIDGELPRRFLGVSVKNQRKSQILEHLVNAVSGTDTPEVRTVLGDIIKRYGEHEFARAAERAFDGLGRQPARAPGREEERSVTLSGDLALFGLPNLLQNLADGGLAGTITIFDPEGKTAEIEIAKNMLVGAEYGRLKSDVAVYQLLELPIEGRFEFHSVADDEDAPSAEGTHSITSLLLEGMRRYDELQRALALIPDGARFKATAKKPTDVDEDGDPVLAKAVWGRAARGAPPDEVESGGSLDAFRIRRLYEHWVTEGALEKMDDTKK